MTKHLLKVLEKQFEQAHEKYSGLMLSEDGSYTISFNSMNFRIRVSQNYPFESPDVFVDDELIPLNLPITEKWSPSFQLFYIVKQLEVYSKLKPMQKIDFSTVISIVRKNPQKFAVGSSNEQILEGIGKDYPKKYQKLKSRTDNSTIEVDITKIQADIDNVFQEIQKITKEINDLQNVKALTKADFIENENKRLNNEMKDNEKKIEELIRNQDLGLRERDIAKQLLQYNKNYIELSEKKKVCHKILRSLS